MKLFTNTIASSSKNRHFSQMGKAGNAVKTETQQIFLQWTSFGFGYCATILPSAYKPLQRAAHDSARFLFTA